MGTVIRFPVEKRMSTDNAGAQPEGRSATIMILPSIRRERLREVASEVLVPQTGTSPGRGRPVRRTPT
jgi:hypothetical protein